MQGMTMWIILGSLIGLVVVFLGVTAFLDRKKAKKLKVKNEALRKQIDEAKNHALIYVDVLAQENEKLLSTFVPSVGKLKMSDIKNAAKEALKAFRHSDEHSLLSADDEGQKIIKAMHELASKTSNTWSKTGALTFFNNELKKMPVSDFEDYRKTAEEKIKGFYEK